MSTTTLAPSRELILAAKDLLAAIDEKDRLVALAAAAEKKAEDALDAYCELIPFDGGALANAAMAIAKTLPPDPSPEPNEHGWTILTGICPHCGSPTKEGHRRRTHVAWLPSYAREEDGETETYTTTETYVECLNVECGYSDADSSDY